MQINARRLAGSARPLRERMQVSGAGGAVRWPAGRRCFLRHLPSGGGARPSPSKPPPSAAPISPASDDRGCSPRPKPATRARARVRRCFAAGVSSRARRHLRRCFRPPLSGSLELLWRGCLPSPFLPRPEPDPGLLATPGSGGRIPAAAPTSSTGPAPRPPLPSAAAPFRPYGRACSGSAAAPCLLQPGHPCLGHRFCATASRAIRPERSCGPGPTPPIADLFHGIRPPGPADWYAARHRSGLGRAAKGFQSLIEIRRRRMSRPQRRDAGAAQAGKKPLRGCFLPPRPWAVEPQELAREPSCRRQSGWRRPPSRRKTRWARRAKSGLWVT